MANISAALVKELREKTGAGMMDCKNALNETNGDIEAAVDWLRKKGLAKAAKKSGRIAADGLVAVAVEANFGVVVEVNSETDFVARNDDFQALVRGITAVALDKGALVEAEAVKGAHYPGGGTVAEAIANAIATIGENISLRRTQGLHVAHGVIGHYVHGAVVDGQGRIGVIVALESTGKAEALSALGRQIAMHIAAASPLALNAQGLDPAVVARVSWKRSSNPASRPITRRSACSTSLSCTTAQKPLRRRSRRPRRPSGRRSPCKPSCATPSARASKRPPKRRKLQQESGQPLGCPFSYRTNGRRARGLTGLSFWRPARLKCPTPCPPPPNLTLA
jgi:elongation factor Ts